MNRIHYNNGNLFDVLKIKKDPVCFVHANNCCGSWGSGIAKQFMHKHYRAYMDYTERCQEHGHDLLGTCSFHEFVEPHQLCNLYTSRGYGYYRDSEEMILTATGLALEEMFLRLPKHITEIHMPKINAGLFRVPWPKTAKIIESKMNQYDVEIPVIVWVLE